jgi:hypothetical protein
MKSLILGTAVMLGLTIASGTLYGIRSNRWGPSETLREAAARLDSLPKNIAAWELIKSEPLDKESLSQLQPAGYIQRLYVNRDNGVSVSVTVMAGRSGPMAVHTPESCYAGRGHEQQGTRQAISVHGDPSADKDTVWKTTFRMKGIDAKTLNIYYAWSSGDHWVAAENPRFTYASEPFLYKLLLANQVPSWANDNEADPGLQFLIDFLPVLRKYLQNPPSPER